MLSFITKVKYDIKRKCHFYFIIAVSSIFPTCMSHSSLSLSSTKIAVNDCTERPHIRSFIKVQYYIYCVISFQVSIKRQSDFVLELEALHFNSEARRNLICMQYLFHFFHKSHYIVVLLQGNSDFHYSM